MPWLSCLCNHQFGVGDRVRRWLRGCHFGIHNSDIPSDGILHDKTVLQNIGLHTEFPLTAWSAAGHSFILRLQTVLRNPGVCAQRRGLDGSSARAASASRAFKSLTIVGLAQVVSHHHHHNSHCNTEVVIEGWSMNAEQKSEEKSFLKLCSAARSMDGCC